MAVVKEYDLADEIREDGLKYKHAEVSDDDSITYVARRGQDLIGYVAAEIQTPPPMVEQLRECHINVLFVREGARRQGVASRLMTTVEEWACSQDCRYIDLNVHPENRAAIDLYETSGYTTTRQTMKKAIEPE